MNNRKKLYKVIRTSIYFLFSILLISPIYIMISTSLKTYTEITLWPPKFFGQSIQWVNYTSVIFGEKNIVVPLINSLIVSIITSILCVLIGILAAYSANKLDFKLKYPFLILIIATQMFAPVILIAPMYSAFRSMGLLDTKLALIISNMATSLPMTVWLLYSYLDSIPKELEEAAWIDGCSRIDGIRYIVFPIIFPAIITTGLFAFISSWGDLMFAKSFILSSESKTISLALLDFESLYKTTWETQMAASVISIIPTFIIFIFIQKYLIKGLTNSGIKG